MELSFHNQDVSDPSFHDLEKIGTLAPLTKFARILVQRSVKSINTGAVQGKSGQM
jgi:hypothetical protein